MFCLFEKEIPYIYIQSLSCCTEPHENHIVRQCVQDFYLIFMGLMTSVGGVEAEEAIFLHLPHIDRWIVTTWWRPSLLPVALC